MCKKNKTNVWFISDSIHKQNNQIGQLTKENNQLQRKIDDLQVQ